MFFCFVSWNGRENRHILIHTNYKFYLTHEEGKIEFVGSTQFSIIKSKDCALHFLIHTQHDWYLMRLRFSRWQFQQKFVSMMRKRREKKRKKKNCFSMRLNGALCYELQVFHRLDESYFLRPNKVDDKIYYIFY